MDAVIVLLTLAAGGGAQTPAGATPQAGTAKLERLTDPLGRDTPRGTVLGFLSAARKGEDQLALTP